MAATRWETRMQGPDDSEAADVAVAIVHYRSGGMLLDLLDDLFRQEGVTLRIHVVESGSDGSLERAEELFGADLTVHRPGRNVGYAGGNNMVIGSTARDPLLIVNPDVRIADPLTVRRLLAHLQDQPDVGAVAPVIVADGLIEYTDSLVDRRRALAIHTGTHLTAWPWPDVARSISWIDGACLLIRREVLDTVGGLDERFFLIAEEVDWCLRMGLQGWTLLLASDTAIEHQRSSSFGGSTKSAYYHARNTYLLFQVHAGGAAWRLHWARRVVRSNLTRSALRTGAARNALRGLRHALRGTYGPAPEDRVARPVSGRSG